METVQPDQHYPHCPFIGIYRAQRSMNAGRKEPGDGFFTAEKVFLAVFKIGIYEVYSFLYRECLSDAHFIQWLIGIRGLDAYLDSVQQFNAWYGAIADNDSVHVEQVLTTGQRLFWNENGYIKISGLIGEQACDDVKKLICQILKIDLKDQSSWYGQHELLQGMMLQLYQDERMAKIRDNEKIRRVFEDLYQSLSIFPNTEKLSYNPPETESYSFMGSSLHWDIDFDHGIRNHIQGLIYLNDVPQERGALTLVPGFHHEISCFLDLHQDPGEAMEAIKKQGRQIAVPGEKGDLILWLEALPHAASPNRSKEPRFVQYVSFTKI